MHRLMIQTYPTRTQHPRDRASFPHEVWQSHRKLSNRDQENLINKKQEIVELLIFCNQYIGNYVIQHLKGEKEFYSHLS